MAEYRIKIRTAQGVLVVARTDTVKEAFQIFQSQTGPAVVMNHTTKVVLFAKGW